MSEILQTPDLPIIFEDNHIVVVIKPVNMPSQEDASGDADLLTAIKDYRKIKDNKQGEAFIGLVHRLDRVTGGVMVFAKTSKAAARLGEQLKQGEFTKKYLAIVNGIPKQNSATLKHYLWKNEQKNIVEVVGQAVSGAKYAELAYRILHQTEKTALVEVELVTGRSHQIRVQMAKIGHPLVGDAKYGKDRGRLALWAYELGFNHPTSGDRMKFVVNPPETEPWDKFDFARKSHKTR